MATQITRKTESTGNKNGLVGLLVFAAIVALGLTALFKQSEKANDVVIDQSVVVPVKKDIPGLVTANANNTTLVSLLTKASLVETLKGTGPFTVFAPTNAAFEKIDAATLASLQDPANVETLKSVLTYHVVSGKVMSKDLTDGQVVTTLNGATLTVKLADGKVMLADGKGQTSTVIAADLDATNGVVHSIDTVLLAQ
jgi:uncharacterized surface protein with fasciclin (FAS1) repeats